MDKYLMGKSGAVYKFKSKDGKHFKCADPLKDAKAENTAPMVLMQQYANDLEAAGTPCGMETPGYLLVSYSEPQ